VAFVVVGSSYAAAAGKHVDARLGTAQGPVGGTEAGRPLGSCHTSFQQHRLMRIDNFGLDAQH
jgi:hypothetical protein